MTTPGLLNVSEIPTEHLKANHTLNEPLLTMVLFCYTAEPM